MEYLWRSYSAVLDKVSESADDTVSGVRAWVHFWQVCLSAAVLSGHQLSTASGTIVTTIGDDEVERSSTVTVTIMRFLLHRPGVLKLSLAETLYFP